VPRAGRGIRHYPFRDLEHAARKVLRERRPRWERERRKYQWHVHYDHLGTEADVERAIVAAAAAARPFDEDARGLLRRLNVEEMAREREEAERLSAATESVRERLRRNSPLVARMERTFWRWRRHVLAFANHS
jgi:hypothetical protein